MTMRWPLARARGAPGAPDGVEEAAFDLRSCTEPSSSAREERAAALASQLRTLLVDFRLLSQPDAVVQGKLPSPWPSQVDRGLAPGLEQELAELTRRLREATAPSPYREPQCEVRGIRLTQVPLRRGSSEPPCGGDVVPADGVHVQDLLGETIE